MEKAKLLGLTVLFTRVIGRMIKGMVKENILGSMVMYTRVIGRALNILMVSKKILMAPMNRAFGTKNENSQDKQNEYQEIKVFGKENGSD